MGLAVTVCVVSHSRSRAARPARADMSPVGTRLLLSSIRRRCARYAPTATHALSTTSTATAAPATAPMSLVDVVAGPATAIDGVALAELLAVLLGVVDGDAVTDGEPVPVVAGVCVTDGDAPVDSDGDGDADADTS